MMERKFTVKVSKPDQCRRVLSIEVPLEEVEREEGEIFRKLKSDLKIPGFRQGKVPAGYIRKNYADVIHSDAVRNLLPEVYEQALIRERIAPLGDPKFENLRAEKGEGITVEVTVEVRPEITIKNYKNIGIVAEKREIGEEDVDRALENLRERMSTFKVVDRPVGAKDFVVVDYAPMENGERIESKALKNYPVDMSSGGLLADFKAGIEGMRAGEEKEITVRYPDDFPEEDLAGRERRFHVSVREVKEKVLPGIDDEFVKQLGAGFASVAELRERIRADLVEEERKRYEHEVEEKVIDQIISREPFDVPETMVENYLASIIEEDRKRRPNVPSEEDREREIRKLYRDSAVRTVKKYFIIEAIKKQENVVVSEDEVNARIEEIAGEGEQKDEVVAYLKHPQRRSRIENELADEKVLNLLRESADIKSV
jgi:trigger factor